MRTAAMDDYFFNELKSHPVRLEFTHFSPCRGSEAAQAEILTPIGWQRTLCYRDAWLRDFQTAIA